MFDSGNALFLDATKHPPDNHIEVEGSSIKRYSQVAYNSVVALLNDQDQAICQRRLPTHLPMILEPLSLHCGEMEGVVVESTYNWY